MGALDASVAAVLCGPASQQSDPSSDEESAPDIVGPRIYRSDDMCELLRAIRNLQVITS